jgi:hypothetical protein
MGMHTQIWSRNLFELPYIWYERIILGKIRYDTRMGGVKLLVLIPE